MMGTRTGQPIERTLLLIRIMLVMLSLAFFCSRDRVRHSIGRIFL